MADEFNALCCVAQRGGPVDVATVLGVFVETQAQSEEHVREAERRMLAAARAAKNRAVISYLQTRRRSPGTRPTSPDNPSVRPFVSAADLVEPFTGHDISQFVERLTGAVHLAKK